MRALTGGTIYVSPTEEPIEDGVLLIEGSSIAAAGRRDSVPIPEASEALDCSRLTITAGFWNSHVHFFERKWANAGEMPADELSRQLQEFTRYGFTSVFDLSSQWENTRRIRERIESGEVRGPSIRSTGVGLIPPGGMPPESVTRVLGMAPVRLPEVSDSAHAVAVSRKILRDGVDGLKLFVSGAPSMPPASLSESVMRAAVHEAHAAGKPVFAHPNSGADVASAVAAGVDVIAHTTPLSGAWNEALLGTMLERSVAITPTLSLWQDAMRHDRISVQEQFVGTAVQQLQAWHDLGAEVLFGTDYGAVGADPSAEYALMSDAGMNFREILAALTTAPAARFGKSDKLGRITAGFQADIAVLSGNPAAGLHHLAEVMYTLRRGEVVYRNTGAP